MIKNKNRNYLQKYVANKKVFGFFSYIGAWGINAALLALAKFYVLIVHSLQLKI